MRVIVATDIFGRTPAIEALADTLASQALVEIVDPYDGCPCNFKNEQEAYRHYTSVCGHDAYLERVIGGINGSREPCVLVGFSAGASVLWRAIAQGIPMLVEHCIGFYPGQIRHHLDLQPNCPTTLVFPCYEQSFDVERAAQVLSAHEQVVCYQSVYKHGFMNPASLHYSVVEARRFGDLLEDLEMLVDVAAFRRCLLAGR
ncbi:dienelactone hydrolase family protein [Aestuariirhabdus sp. Z084]|uniref:dienelactone hydrolase family protein n=1 Tax=Aestuariirhabdus haliotis TaxID=2918751 RepID=UPI00201B3D82|nr:dienelactone hydrolase family protein [Aestuariirhabdus haliotis]MCL6417678.1 dienelactone hydrolase family protein [Aestuariirhabdus haliotis]MCL6421595.1 dienelactone hydrolase family protein [Aestuariirhabdus haliotis]